MSFSDKLKNELETNQQYNSARGNDYFSFKEGPNTFRVLTEPILYFQRYVPSIKKYEICYTDCGYQGDPKFMCYVFDRTDNKVKLARLPFSKGQEIANLENDTDYGFTGFPMPYDITISAKNAGKKEVEYSAPLPRPVKALPDEVLAEIKMVKPSEDIIEKQKSDQKAKHVADGTFQKEQDRKAALAQELASKRVVGGGKPIDSIEYPVNDVNPDDIPF